YGLVCDAETGRTIDNLVVSGVHQEHGLISTIDGAPLPFDRFPVGTQFRILPNHACMTAAAHDQYHLVDGETPTVTAIWPRHNGWAPA
ncbi:MAG: DSD1 family PLP-dependent enzyme, partial [Gammaproteobacteria bacterium]|nr:DSD1 family PLP-dependent enzyme [Gammaproteobacteria bacterium]